MLCPITPFLKAPPTSVAFALTLIISFTLIVVNDLFKDVFTTGGVVSTTDDALYVTLNHKASIVNILEPPPLAFCPLAFAIALVPVSPKKLPHVHVSEEVISVQVTPGSTVVPGQVVVTAVNEVPPSASTLMSQLCIVAAEAHHS